MSDEFDDDEPFLTKEQAEALPYPGVDPETLPLFDEELNEVDKEGQPRSDVINRYREVARLFALGKSLKQIGQILGYNPTHLSNNVIKHPFVQQEANRYRRKLFEQDVADKLKEAAKDGADYIHKVILDEKSEPKHRIDAAKWANEKTYGKARQEVSVESGTLTNFMEMLKEMKSRGETLGSGEFKDVTPLKSTPKIAAKTKEESDEVDFDAWFDQNS